MVTKQLDIIGTICGLTATACFVGAYKIAWPISLVALFIDGILFWKKGLYGDCVLQIIYFIMILYGWWQWLYGGNSGKGCEITTITLKQVFWCLTVAVLGIVLVYLLLRFYTDSQIPVLDATTTVLSLLAFWLSCYKILQCWILWFIVDSFYIGMYFYKAVPAHAWLNIIYLSMAMYGYFIWRRKI
jgi:nicotinamide mononucleotide transporter